MRTKPGEAGMQRAYYDRSAKFYDDLHVNESDEHHVALCFLDGMLDHLNVKSLLDVGSGTGRVLAYMKSRKPEMKILGVEPAAGLREQGYRKGLLKTDLICGDGRRLSFADNSFDAVCAFGVLHHVKQPDQVVLEMLRVAKRAVFISDSNSFGQGSPQQRALKRVLDILGLWKLAKLIQTKGKGYTMSAGDGIAYSYSVFSNFRLIQKRCTAIHVLNTGGTGINPVTHAHHVALLGVKGMVGEQHA